MALLAGAQRPGLNVVPGSRGWERLGLHRYGAEGRAPGACVFISPAALHTVTSKRVTAGTRFFSAADTLQEQFLFCLKGLKIS